jgi:type IV pilus assembly protein PilY1
MIRSIFTCFTEVLRPRAAGVAALFYLVTLATPAAGQSPTALADQPVFASGNVPGNLALTLSVEFPTAISVANLGNYLDTATYYGYFDPVKCYTYQNNSGTASGSYFQATALATGTNSHSCSGKWSGNFMNWATMQTIDPFRWALTGGFRSVDTSTQTILEKAWGSSQGQLSNFPDRGTDQGSNQKLDTTAVSLGSVTPFSSWTAFDSRIWKNGNTMVFSQGGTGYQTSYSSGSVTELPTTIDATVNKSGNNTIYKVYVRVLVCDTSQLGVSGLEGNCVGYGTKNSSGVYSSYKPEGLMQQYSNKIRFAALSYLNSDGQTQQGGVLRAPMSYIGPTYPQPLSSSVASNPRAEWSGTTGIMNANPDPTSATASGVSQSGAMNFLNQFGESSHSYMMHDNISELYYAAIRYFENLGNVPEWDSSPSSTALDGFPAVSTWTDPIAYWCQKNFVLGIGDDHTWYDANVGGGTVSISGRSKPTTVGSDNFNKAATWTTALQNLEGISPTAWWNWTSNDYATYYIAGLAYGAHVLNIRPDLAAANPSQTVNVNISTYWMDVMEYQRAEYQNPYYFAAKYGGFAVPSGYSITNTTPLTQSEFDTTGSTIPMNGSSTAQLLPDNYFEAGSAAQMVSSLAAAFKNIASAIKNFTTSFSLSSPVITSSGEDSFAAQYDPTGWTGTITASTLKVDSTVTPTTTQLWVSSTTLENQLANTGWQNNRSVATWDGSKGVPFEATNGVTSTQLNALSPSTYAPSGTTSTMVLNYLRGDRTNEANSTVTGSQKSLRTRSLLLGDIVDASLTPVGAPSMLYSDAHNPGYSSFKSKYASRATVVYAAANDGMVHAFLGDTGYEQFAYVPSALFQGPSSPATPQVDGLAALANPNYAHVYYIDATPLAWDLDLNNSGGSTSSTPDWETMLIGGLGKGGKSYYALKVTDPSTMNVEANLAKQVAWEFTDTTMGYSFGAPIVVKTAKYGWVVVLTSGYDNSDGYGYLYFVNPSTGALLEKVATPQASSGLTQATSFVLDVADFTADAIYVGDLNGQLWRFDVTGTSGTYPAPTLIATLKDASGTAQPITAAPMPVVSPTTRLRYIMVGTGQLLSSTDIASTATQSFYAIVDGTGNAFNKGLTTVTRSNLSQVTNLLNGVGSPGTTTGWYYDMTGSGERVTLRAAWYGGTIAWAASIPTTDACVPNGKSNIYDVDFATGKTVIYTTAAASYYTLNNSVTNFGFIMSGSTVELVAGDRGGGITKVPTTPTAATATHLLNWLDIPTAE